MKSIIGLIIINRKLIFLLIVQLILGILIGHFTTSERIVYASTSIPKIELRTKSVTEIPSTPPPPPPPSSNILIINLNESIDGNFSCAKTKTLLNHISTTICLHEANKDTYVSKSFRGTDSIWEEEGVTRILQLLIRHPHLDFIDIGANIGTYTMYAAALGRFVLAIDCFAPNLNRIRRAIQLTNLANRVVLIQNALFTHSGQTLRLSNDATNIGGQELDVSKDQINNQSITNNQSVTNNQSIINNPYIVKTIRFDELVPILIARGIRGALMKIDIEGSESFVVESGSQIFDTFEIPFIVMEWLKVRHYPERVKVIFDFFAKRNYAPLSTACQPLNPMQHSVWPGDIYWLKRNVSNFC